jgi:hypothetical protein
VRICRNLLQSDQELKNFELLLERKKEWDFVITCFEVVETEVNFGQVFEMKNEWNFVKP